MCIECRLTPAELFAFGGLLLLTVAHLVRTWRGPVFSDDDLPEVL